MREQKTSISCKGRSLRKQTANLTSGISRGYRRNRGLSRTMCVNEILPGKTCGLPDKILNYKLLKGTDKRDLQMKLSRKKKQL